MYSLVRIKGIKKEKPRKSACFRGFLARHTGFEPVASRLGVVKTVSRFVTGFHSRYQKTPVFGRLWMYCIPHFHT